MQEVPGSSPGATSELFLTSPRWASAVTDVDQMQALAHSVTATGRPRPNEPINSARRCPAVVQPTAGQWIVVLGDNGTGKTSLLRILAGLDAKRMNSLWAPFFLFNVGCAGRVLLQILTDFAPSVAYPLIGVTGFIELSALLWWGIELWRTMNVARVFVCALALSLWPTRLHFFCRRKTFHETVM